MVNPFEVVILRLQELGFFTFLLPFILMAAVLYGLLRKSQIFGPPERNVAVNATVAIVVSFLVLAAPVITGIKIEEQLAKFFLQSMIASVVLIVVVLIAGMFVGPDLPTKIQEKLGAKYVGILLISGVLVGLTLLITSGLTSVFFPENFGFVSEDVILSIATILILLISIVAIVVFVSREEKKK